MPKGLIRAIDYEKRAYFKDKDSSLAKQDEIWMDLSEFLEDGEDDALDGKRAEELGEEIYNQVVKP